MSQTVITTAFEQWKARQAESGEPVLLDEFVFASVPGLNPDKPVSRSEALPPEAQIVYRQSVSRKGVVNKNAVVHSAVLGADVGDFTFNWIGLINKASGVLAMIVHAPEQQKLKTREGQQGNVLTRSFLMEYNGAQAETGISTPAETWQIDFTARMAGIDERQRIENVDLYGAAAFFDTGFLVTKSGNEYSIAPGVGYVAGLRSQLAEARKLVITQKPVFVWVDVCFTGTLTSVWGVEMLITVASDHASYVAGGRQHYVFAVASINAEGAVTDLRPKGNLTDQAFNNALKKHEQSRNHPDASTSEKGFTKLSNATDSESESMSATPRAVKSANDNANKRVPADRKINGHVLSGDINLSSADVGAFPLVGGAIKGNLSIEGADYLTKGAFVETADDRSTLGLRLNGQGGQRSDDYFYEKKGEYASKRVVVTSGGKSSVFDLRMDGTIVVDHPTGRMAIYPDGNISGSKWGGYLSDWVNLQITGINKWVSENFASLSWVKSSFVNDIRLGYGVSLNKPVNTNTFTAPPGYVFTFIDVGDGPQVVANASALQKNINGTWYTVSKV